MSATTADLKLTSAKDHLKAAQKDLLVFLDSDTYGHHEYTHEYVLKVLEVYSEIMKLSFKF